MKENKYSNFTNHKLSSTTQLLWVKAHASHVSLLASASLADLVARLCPNTALFPFKKIWIQPHLHCSGDESKIYYS